MVELIGKGGMGAVYKARQTDLDRAVAIKVLSPVIATDPTFADRFKREARAMARLNHPNIVGIYESGNQGGYYFLVMEYVEGVNLREAIQEQRLSPQEALAIVPQICDALQFAHDEGIVHRDIKPENVLIDSRGRVKIADFGLAKLVSEDRREETLTHTHQVMGTVRYMAPEQMQGTHDVDHRADIYSLGVVFYELLTGEVPMGSFEPPSQRVGVDARVDQVVLRALAQEPRRRYQHASEVKTDLDQFAGRHASDERHLPSMESDPTVGCRAPVNWALEKVDVEMVREDVRIPGWGLLIVGLLTCLTAVLPWLLTAKTLHDLYDSRVQLETDAPSTAREFQREGQRPTQSAQFGQADTISWPKVLLVVGLAILLPPLGIVIMIGGGNLLQLRNSSFAMLGSLLACLPTQPFFFLGPIFGIWAMVVLRREETRLAFLKARQDLLLQREQESNASAEESSEEDEEEAEEDSSGAGLAIGICVGIGAGLVLENVGLGIAIGFGLALALGGFGGGEDDEEEKDEEKAVEPNE